MSYQLSADTVAVLHEVRPQPTLEELKAALAPAVAQLESVHAQLTAEENQLRDQLDAKLKEVSSAFAQLQKYYAAANEIDGQSGEPSFPG